MKKYKVIVIILAILLAGVLVVGGVYNYEISATSRKSKPVTIEIKEGSTPYSIGNILYENKLIRNKLIYKIYVKMNRIRNIKASTYELNHNMNLKKIMDALEEGNSYNPDEITILFKEGLNVRKIARKIEEETNNSYDDVMKLMNDNEYIDSLITKYWFLTDKIKNPKIYYPLEGYLFPNKYAFLNKDVTPKEIIETMLDEMDKQLTPYKEKIEKSEFSIHEIITLASIVELEGGNADDRKGVAGVFYNRIKDGWVLGSDVTTYYYLKIDDFKQSLNGNPNLTTCDNAYNTRCTSYVGLPVGPISNPGHESIEATIEYSKHDYYYFVADCKGKTYLNKDSYGHYNTIQKLQNEGNWCV
ncbi:MAG: endolytic transglycosylase MltG [Bacilli bacterium]|nr:endolytic transglycosylase MltG [Bacilli bacterium]